jgi:ribonuclease Z
VKALRWAGSAGLVVLVAAVASCERIESLVYDRAANQVLQGDRDELLDDGAMHAILCGTGSPLPDPDRAAACTAIIAGGRMYLVDVGPGSWENVQTWRLPRAHLAGVLLTHFHSDHIGDLGETVMQSWVAGRTEPLNVYGPPGVRRVTEGFRLAYGLDSTYRVAHHGGEVMPPSASTVVGVTIEEPPAGESALVLEQDGLKITAFSVDHRPVQPAFGYRFEWGGRVVVVSGDTAKSESLVKHAQGADVLVHEALAAHMIQRLQQVLAARGATRLAKLSSDIINYHTTPAEAVAEAQQAGVRALLLTHLVPPPVNPIVGWLFLAGAEVPDGLELIMGDDGTHVRLPRDSEDIEVGVIE